MNFLFPLRYGLGALACLSLFASPLLAQNKPTKIIVPFGAGGVADLTARTVAQKLSESSGQSFVIENRPGAGGIGAAEAVAKSEPDGTTLLLMSNGSAVSASLFKSLPFDTVKDFTPIATLGSFDLALITRADSPLKSLADLLTFARANPGKLNIGTINIGSTQNLAAELFKTQAKIDAQIVPFNGTPAIISALRGGQIDLAVEILGPTLTQIKSGAVRALAVTGDRRASALPDVPTAHEAGVVGFVVSSWNALAAPAKTPSAVITRLNRDINNALASPDVKQKLAALNVEPRGGTADAAAALLASEIKRWGEVIQRAKIPQQ